MKLPFDIKKLNAANKKALETFKDMPDMIEFINEQWLYAGDLESDENGVFVVDTLNPNQFFEYFLPDFNYSDHSTHYGVADNTEQIMSHVGPSNHVRLVFAVRLLKSDCSERDGWRWHKWGEYIGTQNPQCEYLYDEPEIDEIMIYSVYDRVIR